MGVELMVQPRFDNTITLGSILSIGTMVITLFGGVIYIEKALSSQAERIVAIDERVKSIEVQHARETENDKSSSVLIAGRLAGLEATQNMMVGLMQDMKHHLEAQQFGLNPQPSAPRRP